jgi:hypothetical protein
MPFEAWQGKAWQGKAWQGKREAALRNGAAFCFWPSAEGVSGERSGGVRGGLGDQRQHVGQARAAVASAAAMDLLDNLLGVVQDKL